MTLTPEERLDTITAMRSFGGSFVRSLADAWAYADPQNAAIIEQAFARVIAVYRAHARQAPRMVA